MKIKRITGWVSVLAVAGCVVSVLPAQAQFGGLTKALPGASAGAAVDGGAFLTQLTPGSADFAKAYSLYYEGLGESTQAAKYAKVADQLSNGGQFDKNAKATMDGGQKDISELLKKKATFDDTARAKFTEGNKLYTTGIEKWTVVSAAVSAAVAKDPKAVLTNPPLQLASASCVKGLADMTKFLGVMMDVSKVKSEANK